MPDSGLKSSPMIGCRPGLGFKKNGRSGLGLAKSSSA